MYDIVGINLKGENNLRIAICDDDIKIAEYISNKIKSRYPNFEIEIFENPASLMDYLNNSKNKIDLLFMDIVLGDENGIDAAAKIVKAYPNIMTVFMTAFANEYSEEIFSKIKPYGYLHKPVKDDVLFGYIDRAKHDAELQGKVLSVKEGMSVMDIPFEKIVYIESEKRIVHIHCDGVTHDIYAKLDDIEKSLDDSFIRCHKSFIVNTASIKSIEKGFFRLKDGKEITISKSEQSDVRIKYFKVKGRELK